MNEGEEAAVGGRAGGGNYSSYEIVIKTLWGWKAASKAFTKLHECAGAASIDFNWKTFFLRSENFLPTFHPSVSPRPSFTKFTATGGNSTEFSFSKQTFPETNAEIPPFGGYAIGAFLDESATVVKSW